MQPNTGTWQGAASSRGLAVPLCLGLLAWAGPAAAVDVSQLSDFENDPCVMALAERNTAQHVDAPDSVLSDECERAHGNIEVAWDFLLRTWQPRETPATSGAAMRLAPLGLALATFQMLLVYTVLGAPIRAWLCMASTSRRAEAAGSLFLRYAMAGLLLLVLRLPVMTLLGSVAALAAAIAAGRRSPYRLAPAAAAGPMATILAAVANDAASAAGGLLALALVAHGTGILLVVAVALAPVLGLPPVHRARLAIRENCWATAAAVALLAMSLAFLGAADPAVSRMAGSNQRLFSGLLAGIFVLVALWRLLLVDAVGRHRRDLSAR